MRGPSGRCWGWLVFHASLLGLRGGIGFAFLPLLVALWTKLAPAAGPQLDVRLRCDRALVPGRVRCAVSLSVPRGFRLSWVDALVVSSPPFARPLRARIPLRRLTGMDSHAEVLLALLAREAGRGMLTVRGRAVVCPRQGDAVCRPASSQASLEFSVGS